MWQKLELEPPYIPWQHLSVLFHMTVLPPHTACPPATVPWHGTYSQAVSCTPSTSVQCRGEVYQPAMQQDKQGTTMNTISQRTANKFIPETLTVSGEVAIAFLEISMYMYLHSLVSRPLPPAQCCTQKRGRACLARYAKSRARQVTR